MKNIFSGFGIIVLVALVVLGSQALYTVQENEQVIVTRLGEPVRIIDQPGLQFKTPVAETAVYLEKWNLEYDIQKGRELEIIAANEERLIIDAYVRYKISNPLEYFEAFNRGSANWVDLKRTGEGRIGTVLEAALRRALGEVTINEIITTKRAELMQTIQADMEVEAGKFGVSIIDVRIRRADFPDQNADKVYERMKSERLQQAQLIRAEGEEEAKRIRADAAKQVTIILAEAEEESQKIRGRAEGQQIGILAEAYEKDREFFEFYRSLKSYEVTLNDQDTTFVLSPDSDFFKYFKDINGQ